MATGRIPTTSLPPPAKLTPPTYKEPVEVTLTLPTVAKEAIVVEPNALIDNMEAALDELTWKALLVPVPCTKKFTVDDVAFTPITVPLFRKSEAEVKLLEELKYATCPLLPEPVMLLPPTDKVICPGVVVLIVMLVPATRVVGAYLVPVPSAANSCPVTVGAVEVPVPPLAGAMAPVIPIVDVPVMAMLVPAVNREPISE